MSSPVGQDRAATTRHGLVRDSSGKPVAGAQIRRLGSQVSRLCPDPNLGSIENLYLVADDAGAPPTGRDKNADPGWSVRTDGEGRFQGPPETVKAPAIYLVTAEGYAPRLEGTEQANDTKVVLDRGNDLVIHLRTDKEAVVGDAQATLIPLSLCQAALQALAEPLVRSARADSEGTVEIRSVPDGVYALRFVAKGRTTSNLAPVVVGKGHSEFRLRLPPAPTFSAALEIPPQTTSSPGTIVAFWNDSAGVPQWTDGRLTSGESSFDLDGLPLFASFSLLIRTDNGLSSIWVRRQDVGGSRTAPVKTIPLRPPGSWEGRLEDGQKSPPLLVEPIFPASFPPFIRSGALTIPIDTDGRFVVPEVPPAAERLRIVVPGRGEAEVELKEGSGFDFGIVRIQPHRTIERSIAWEDGQPLGGAEIEVHSSGRAVCGSRTTLGGQFACASAGPDRDLQFTALVAGTELGFSPPAAGPSGTLAPSQEALLRLRVTRPGGKVPVRDLQICLGPNQEDAASGRNSGRGILYGHSRDGTFALDIPEEGRTRLTVSVPNGGPETSTTVNVLPSGPPTDAALTLPDGPAVFGKVLAGDTRNPVGGAEVEMRVDSLYRDHADVARILHTAVEGSWRFDEVRDGEVQLSASAQGYSPAAKKSSVPAETDHTAQDLVLQRPGRLQVKVLGLPEKSEASLSVWSKAWWMVRNNYQGDFDSSGQLVLGNIRPDRYGLSLSVKAPSSTLGRQAETQVRPGETAEVEFDLRKGITLSGRAYLGDRPIPGARITFSSYSGEMPPKEASSIPVDGQGQYSVVLPSAGRYTLNMFDPSPENRGKMINLGRLLEIGAESPQNRDLRFDDGRIRGRILDSEGRPISGARIHISSIHSAVDGQGESPWENIGHTGETGSFEFGPLSSGDYVLDIRAGGFAGRWIDSIPLAVDQTVELQDIVLDPEMAFRVKAVDPQGLPLPGMAVSAFLPPGLDRPGAFGKTGESGVADMKGISPGTYTLMGLLPGWPPAIVTEVKVPSSPPTVLQVGQGGRLDIQVLDRSGSPVTGLQPHIIDATGQDVTTIYGFLANLQMSPWQTDAEGRASLTAVIPGDYSIQVGSGKDSDVRRVIISTGKTSRITLVIP